LTFFLRKVSNLKKNNFFFKVLVNFNLLNNQIKLQQMSFKFKYIKFKRLWVGAVSTAICFLLSTQVSFSQKTQISFKDLSHFKDPGKSWSVAGKVNTKPEEQNTFAISKGTGILVNLPNKRISDNDLHTVEEFGDMDLELDYMVSKGSNSGIYFMGQYELQLKDSWGTQLITSGENGGIYERWDESKREGQKGYQGYAPRQNVSKGPGLWQHLVVSFQAPRFDSEGKKIENAKFIKVELNRVTIQENVELFGPTRGGRSDAEKAKGPIRIQGDHGAVAFRNMAIISYDKPRPELKNLEYAVYEGKFSDLSSYDSLPPEFEGPLVILSSNLKTKSNQFLVRYTGNMEVKETGEYNFNLKVPGGLGIMRINGKEVISPGEQEGKGSVQLKKGMVPLELIYSKFQDWVEPGLELTIEGPGIREYFVSDGEGTFEEPVDPILVEATENTLLRSFMDLPVNQKSGGYRVTHSVNVGSPLNVHYTYDMDYGNLVQVWRGGFLDVTPMWYSRGDGSSRPRGAVQYFGVPSLTLSRLDKTNTTWATDTIGSGYRQLGYQLDAQELPTFIYTVHKAQVQDAIRPLENGHGIRRTINIQNPGENLYARLAQGEKIEMVSRDLYLIGDKAFYLRLDNAGGSKPMVRDVGGMQELIVNVQNQLIYSILF